MKLLPLVGLAALSILSATSIASAKEKPFPVDKSVILREGGVTYIVEGRMVIPRGVEVSCQKDVHVIGRGEGATIVVEGDLAVHGVGGREVIFENLTVELAERFEECRLDSAILREGASIRSAAGKAVSGDLHLELTSLVGRSELNVVFGRGSIELRSFTSGAPVEIRAKNLEGAAGNRVKVFVLSSDVDGISVQGVRDCSVRLSRLGGSLASFNDCRTLQLDGLKIESSRLEVKQSAAGSMNRTKVLKCDIYSDKVALHAPKGEGRKVDRVRFERCWFRGRTDVRKIHAEILEDAADDPRNVAHVILVKVNERPLELGGAWTR